MTQNKLKSHPALFVVDMQNGFVHDNGTFAKLGMPVQYQQQVIPTIRNIIDAFKSKKLPVIFFRLGWSKDYSDGGLLIQKVPQIKDVQGLQRGTWDTEIVDELKPSATDLDHNKNWIVVDKIRNSGFYKTILEDKLKELDVDQLIVTGVGTNVCVESTVRDAITYGFPAATVSDATATLTKELHEATLENMRTWFADEIDSKELLQELDQIP